MMSWNSLDPVRAVTLQLTLPVRHPLGCLQVWSKNKTHEKELHQDTCTLHSFLLNQVKSRASSNRHLHQLPIAPAVPSPSVKLFTFPSPNLGIQHSPDHYFIIRIVKIIFYWFIISVDDDLYPLN